MAFQSYDEYVKNFGAALAGAASPAPAPMNPATAGAFGGAPQDAIPQGGSMLSSGPPPAAPQSAQPAAGAFGPAPAGAASPETPAAPAGPFTPAPSGAPAGPPQSGAFTQKTDEQGLTMKKLFDDSPPEERKQLADEMEKQVPGGDLVAAAKAAEQQDPELAAKWGSPDEEWDREEAGAFLFEFGLRMLQASGTGEGNFFSDVGSSALGAMEARRAFHREEDEKATKAEDREWELKRRERDEKKWGAQDREEVRERKRRAAQEERAKRAEQRAQEQHEKSQSKGDWVKSIDENGNVVFEDPNTKQRWETGTKVDETTRLGGRGPTAFEIEWDFYKNAHVPEGWDILSPTEQAEVRKQFMRYKKTSSNLGSVVLRQEMELAKRMIEDRRGQWRGKPFEEVLAAARQQMQEQYPELYEGMGGNGGFTPDWAIDDEWHPPMVQ